MMMVKWWLTRWECEEVISLGLSVLRFFFDEFVFRIDREPTSIHPSIHPCLPHTCFLALQIRANVSWRSRLGFCSMDHSHHLTQKPPFCMDHHNPLVYQSLWFHTHSLHILTTKVFKLRIGKMMFMNSNSIFIFSNFLLLWKLSTKPSIMSYCKHANGYYFFFLPIG